MILEIKNLVKRYKDLVAVDNVNLFLKEGEILGLLGPNGAGKTTLINAILGLTNINSGEIKIFGKKLNENERDIKKNVGIVPQDIAVFYDLTGYENVAYFAALYGLKGNMLKERVGEALSFTGISDKKNEMVSKYSGGMKRRLNIACAIIHHPKLIIMDEPTVGIDPQSRKHILNSVRELNKQGSTIIYTSHYMEEVEELCTKITIMDNGRIIAEGTKDVLADMVSFEDKLSMELSGVNYTLVEGIKSVKGVKDCVIDGKKVTVISEKSVKNIRSIIDKVQDSSVDIINLNVEKYNLEDVFLKLTGKTLRD
jgi:ABC-2 type transport system ATP-binding protein